MFWRFGGYSSISAIDTLLDKPDVTLEEVLDESDLMSELKQNNSKLVEYLREDEILKRLLDYVISPSLIREEGGNEKEKESDDDDDDDNHEHEDGEQKSSRRKETKNKATTTTTTAPTNDDDKSSSTDLNEEEDEEDNDDAALAHGDADLDAAEKARLRYAYIACEILSSNTWSIIETLLQHEQYLLGFWRFLSRPAPLDSLQSGYFTKVNEALLECKTAEMLAFFRSMEGIVKRMLVHVDNPMIMDLLLKIISLERAEGGMGIVEV